MPLYDDHLEHLTFEERRKIYEAEEKKRTAEWKRTEPARLKQQTIDYIAAFYRAVEK